MRVTVRVRVRIRVRVRDSATSLAVYIMRIQKEGGKMEGNFGPVSAAERSSV